MHLDSFGLLKVDNTYPQILLILVFWRQNKNLEAEFKCSLLKEESMHGGC